MSFLSAILGVNTDNPYSDMRGLAMKYGQRADELWDPSSNYYTGRLRELGKTGMSAATNAANLNRVNLARQGVNSAFLNRQFQNESEGNMYDKLFSAGNDMYYQGAGLSQGFSGMESGAMGQFGQGKQWAAEQGNSLIDQVLGLGGGMATGGLGFLGGIGGLFGGGGGTARKPGAKRMAGGAW